MVNFSAPSLIVTTYSHSAGTGLIAYSHCAGMGPGQGTVQGMGTRRTVPSGKMAVQPINPQSRSLYHSLSQCSVYSFSIIY